LRQDQGLYRFLGDLPIACHEIRVSGEVVYVNASECLLLGLSEQEILGRPIWEFVAPDEQARSREAVRSKMSGEVRLVPFERDYLRPDGTRLVLEIHERHIHDEKMDIVGMRSFLFDVTQRRRTEAALQESEKLYRHLVEHASDIIYKADLQGRFRVFNAMAPKLLGYSAEELVGRKYLDLIRPDYRPAVQRFYRQQLARKLSHTYLEFPAISKDGTEFWFGQNVEIIEENGRVAGFQAITRDITLQRRSQDVEKDARGELERRVRERTAELENANELLRREVMERQREEKARRRLEAQVQHAQRLESLGVLAGGIAHDFNNLLTAIMGYAGMALPELAEGSSARTAIDEVVAAAKSAAQLTQQMLAYSGRGKFTIEPINLGRLIEDCTRLVNTLISKKAVLQVKVEPDLPSIEGDFGQIRQVFINLLTNASDALGEHPGTIQVTAGACWVKEGELPSVLPNSRLQAGRYVFIEIADTGCGMDEATMARIFDPFFTTKFTGRGLGLAAVQGIVRGHNGTLQVRSEPGSGTTFRVLFPAGKAPVGEAAKLGTAADNQWHPEGTVLVVDDESTVRALASKILANAGLTVMTAVDGCDAIRQFEAHAGEIRAVLLDLTMPGLDGGEVFQNMIRMDPTVKVILSSGYDVHDVAVNFGAHAPAAFLRKPYSPADLIRVFRSVL
jgi:two-component system, cell cycle sensor histidine kinase and response regulator CckA